MPMLLGNKIKEIRKKSKLSQTRFGKKIGISGKAVSAYETGRSMPSVKVLEKISRTYHVPYLEAGEEEEQEIRRMISTLENFTEKFKEMLGGLEV